MFYGDEVTPGNVLRQDNKRKMFAVYVSIKEFGPNLLKHERMWLPLFVVRSVVAKKIPGGISACIRAIFRRLFLHEKVSSNGILIECGEAQHVNL